MKQFYLLWLSTLFTVPVLAQVPQPALPSVQPFQTYGSGSSFAPAPAAAAVIHTNQNRNASPSSALVGSSGINNYQSDRQQIENERRDYQQILEEAHRDMNRPKPIQYTLPSHSGEPGANCYNQAFGELNNMLSGKAPLNLKRAVFLVENAYIGNTMEYAAFCKHIDNLAQFCRIRMQQEHTNTKDNTALNDLVYRFLSDTLTIKDPATGKKVTHYPVRYNFDDYRGDKDWTSQFVTKLIFSDIPKDFYDYYHLNCRFNDSTNPAKFSEFKSNTKYAYTGNYDKYVDLNNELFEVVSISPPTECVFQH